MAIYSKTQLKLTSLTEKKFELESGIQKLAEANLETLFGLSFVSGATNKEFSVRVQEQDFYIDTLGFDETQKSFVIIEYKKDKSFSVIDQGFAYLSAMLNHKADFVLEINRRLHRTYGKEDIDWEQSRVIFVSPEFTNYQRNAINFKDLPIFLYEVRLYTNDFVEFNAIKPYRTTESIGALSKDKTIKDVSKEVKVYTEDDVIGKDETRQELYGQLKATLKKIDSSFVFHPTRAYIGLQKSGNWRNIIGIEPYQHSLRIYFNRSKPEEFIDPQQYLTYRENSFKNYNQHMSGFILKSEEDLLYFINLFKQLYDRFVKEYSK